MLEFLKKEANRTRTENGGAAYASTMSHCLDLFSTIGALRAAPEGEIAGRFLQAWCEDRDLAVRIAFFARDIRGGLGERRTFRVILRSLAALSPETVKKNLPNIPEYGRWDDLLCLLDTPCREDALALIAAQLKADMAALAQEGESVSLLGKWLPSVNASSQETVRAAKTVARSLKMDDRTYRKTLAALRRRIAILENSLREKDYTFDYEKQPSRAMLVYRAAFLRNDRERYEGYLEQVRAGKAGMHTAALYPYDLVAAALRDVTDPGERLAIDTAWNALPDYCNGERALAVVDGSGSMYWSAQSPTPAAVALSLGLYFAQRNTGPFHGHYITFSHRPQLVEAKGRDLFEQVRFCRRYNEAANTNVQAVFDLILDTAVKHRLPQSELPSALFFISDMEFDRCTENAGMTNFDYAKKAFAAKGYALPQVVFWNVCSRNRQQPVTRNQQGATLLSGCTPRLFEMALSGVLDPYGYMMRTLDTPRYRDLGA